MKLPIRKSTNKNKHLLTKWQVFLLRSTFGGENAMPYTLPTFNLTCRITHGGGATVDTVCNLAFSRRNKFPALTANVGATPMTMIIPVYILLPAGTDIRGAWEAGGNRDIIEVVIGSGRKYTVAQVDDAGKGFANEHRVAICYQYQSFGVPIP